jgi:hypothetical protein
MHLDGGDKAGTTEETAIAAPFSKDEPPVGMLLHDRLARDWDNRGEIDAICQFELDDPGGGHFTCSSRLSSSSTTKGSPRRPARGFGCPPPKHAISLWAPM